MKQLEAFRVGASGADAHNARQEIRAETNEGLAGRYNLTSRALTELGMGPDDATKKASRQDVMRGLEMLEGEILKRDRFGSFSVRHVVEDINIRRGHQPMLHADLVNNNPVPLRIPITQQNVDGEREMLQNISDGSMLQLHRVTDAKVKELERSPASKQRNADINDFTKGLAEINREIRRRGLVDQQHSSSERNDRPAPRRKGMSR